MTIYICNYYRTEDWEKYDEYILEDAQRLGAAYKDENNRMFFIQDFEGKNVSLIPTDADFEKVKNILEANECFLAKFGRPVVKQIEDYSTWPVEKLPHVVKVIMCMRGELHDPEIEKEIEEVITTNPYLYKLILDDEGEIGRKKREYETEISVYRDYSAQLDEVLRAFEIKEMLS